MKNRSQIRYGLAAVLWAVFFTLAEAQTFKASITGLITDPTGAVLPGVTVLAINEATNVQSSVLTDDNGVYTLPELTPGSYQVRAELPGFKAYRQRGVVLQIEQTLRIDIRMEVGEVTENVEVVAQVPLVNTETSSKGQVITHEEITDLPLEGRDFTELAYLTAGVTPKAPGSQGAFANINGARADSINFIVDGGTNQNPRGAAAQVRPAIDAIQEFKVQTSNYTAEYGRLSSGVINAVLKSGTNAFHGTLYDFHRNDFFDARNFFDQDKSKLLRHSFGANIGGPIHRDKMFFFFSYEGQRERAGIPRLTRVPSLKERQGDFSETRNRIVDPLTRQFFRNNTIPQSRFHPVSTKLLEFYPLPNLPTPFGNNNYFSNKLDRDQFDDFITKVDRHFERGDSLSVRYLFNNRFIVSPFAGSVLPGFGNEADLHQQMWGVNYTHLFRPTFINQTTLNFTRTKRLEHSINWKMNFAEKLGIKGVTEDPQLFGFPVITVRGYASLADSGSMPLDFTVNNYQLNNMTTLVQGEHNPRFGVEIVRTQFFQLFANNSRGTFQFQGRRTSRSTNPRQQEPLADFLLGLLNNSSRRIRQTTNYLFSTTYGFYFQDDWKVRRNLTLNLGVRYELLIPPYDKNNNWSNFVLELGRVVLSGEPGFPRSLIYADKNNISPRIGFAWRPFGKKETVVRTGYGLFYGMTIQNPLRLQLGANPPFTIVENFSGVQSNPFALTFSEPFPSNRAVIAGVNAPRAYQIRAASGQLQQYNLTVEQQIGSTMALEMAYVGSKGTHLGRQYDINQPLRGPDVPLPFPRPFPTFAAIQYFAFDADSSYNALQVSWRKRGRDLNFRVNYVFSKSIDDASQLSGSSDGGFGGVQDTRNRNAEHALSDFDRRHAVTGSILYRLPFGRGGKKAAALPGWLDLLVGGWQVNSLVRIFSGTPFTPQLASFDFNAGEAKRPDRLGSGRVSNLRPEKWFEVDDFEPVPAGAFRFGNSGRNILIGPGDYLFDFSMVKTFSLPNEHKLQLRWEIFNVPNHVNFGLPNHNIDVPDAGVITTASEPRRMQVALKYIF